MEQVIERTKYHFLVSNSANKNGKRDSMCAVQPRAKGCRGAFFLFFILHGNS